MVDFIWKKSDSDLVILEVKTSSPNFDLENKDDHDNYILSLFEKFNAALHATIGITLDLPNYKNYSSYSSIHTLDTLKGKLHITLVIKTAKDEWLSSISDGINTSSLFQNLCKSSGVKLSVVNPKMANKLLGMSIVDN